METVGGYYTTRLPIKGTQLFCRVILPITTTSIGVLLLSFYTGAGNVTVILVKIGLFQTD